MPQWKAPIEEWGFDGTATPPWFMVKQTFHGESKTLNLDFANGKLVRSVNERIVTIRELLPDAGSRVFGFSGRSPHRTRIEVRDPKTNGLESTLEVSVKSKKTYIINFFFVEDKSRDRTIHQPSILDGLIDKLNTIYNDQTNVFFELGGSEDFKIDITLSDVVYERGDAGEGGLYDKHIWKKIFAKTRGRLDELNVFFVPAHPVDKNPNAIPYTDDERNCVIEDGKEFIEIILPHAVGRMLGCPPDFKNKHHLMFFDFNLRRDGNFIPKHCANIMNSSSI